MGLKSGLSQTISADSPAVTSSRMEFEMVTTGSRFHLETEGGVVQLALFHLAQIRLSVHSALVVGVSGHVAPGDYSSLVVPSDKILAYFVQTLSDPPSAVLGVDHHVGPVVPLPVGVVVGALMVPVIRQWLLGWSSRSR